MRCPFCNRLPTIDPVTQTLVAGPIIVLWLIGTALGAGEGGRDG